MFKITTLLALIVLLSSLVLAPHSAVADMSPQEIESAVQKLMKSKNRPTILQIKAAFREWPKQNPFPGSPSTVTASTMTELAPVIAYLEQIFPGGIFVGMGRDQVPMVDALDAYYQSIGQTGRSIRLNASGPTIRPSSYEDLAQFMKNQGIDLDLKTNQKYILYDGSYYRDANNQSVRLMVAAFQYAASKGVPASTYALSFGFMNTVPGYGKHFAASNSASEMIAYLTTNLKSIGNVQIPPALALPRQPSNGVLAYNKEWHDSFSGLKNNKGYIYATPGSQNSGNKSQILYELFEVINQVSSEKFKDEVNKVSIAGGYKYRAPYFCKSLFASVAVP